MKSPSGAGGELHVGLPFVRANAKRRTLNFSICIVQREKQGEEKKARGGLW